MEARAVQRSVRQSPRKMRLVVDLVRGKPVNQAFALLKFSKKGAARQVSKVLLSAVAKPPEDPAKGGEGVAEDTLVVPHPSAERVATLKRLMAARRGPP